MQDQASNQLLPAAQYMRMSTEHQQYSIANQSAAIALYAAAHNIGIVRSFVDEGKSGTTIKGRRALQELIQIVQSGAADFKSTARKRRSRLLVILFMRRTRLLYLSVRTWSPNSFISSRQYSANCLRMRIS